MDIYTQAVILVTIYNVFSQADANGTGFTFELPDRKRFCFGEHFEGPREYIAEYRVLKGGNKDVDVHIKSPNGKLLYQKFKVSDGTYKFESSRGDFMFCFGNEFSSWVHKTIYFELRPADVDLLSQEAGLDKPGAKTAFEASCEEIHVKMTNVVKYQRDYRLKESIGRYLAEALKSHVTWWAVTQTLAILVTGLGQSFILKRFFTHTTSETVIKETT